MDTVVSTEVVVNGGDELVVRVVVDTLTEEVEVKIGTNVMETDGLGTAVGLSCGS